MPVVYASMTRVSRVPWERQSKQRTHTGRRPDQHQSTTV